MAGRGRLPAFRDATLFKIAYAYGLRRNEVRQLETVDFGRNPSAREFGEYGVLYVRHGKATMGSPPKRRSVLTVFEWTTEIIEQWLTDGLPRFGWDGPGLFPSERRRLLGLNSINARFARYRGELGLSPGLDFHSFRRSYVTHLIEAGVDALFVQQQAGHEHASTTSIYTCVSSDYRVRTFGAHSTAPSPRRSRELTRGRTMRREVSYRWHLAELMARHGMHNTTDLMEPLRERGIDLSASQIYRLVTQTPERVSLRTLAALRDIFGCGLEELITTTGANVVAPKTAVGGGTVVELNTTVRPRRARVVSDDRGPSNPAAKERAPANDRRTDLQSVCTADAAFADVVPPAGAVAQRSPPCPPPVPAHSQARRATAGRSIRPPHEPSQPPACQPDITAAHDP